MSLKGRGIVITRPRELAPGLARRVEEAGGEAFVFPAIEIADLPPPAALKRLDEFDLAVFISPTAAAKALAGGPRWPQHLRAAAVGAGTRRELEGRGLPAVLAPGDAADSEALLALPELRDAGGKRVVIFRGEGGRALLGDTLRQRGARVEYAECYRRVRPQADAAPLLAQWARVHGVTVSSAEGLENLFALLGGEGAARLRATPVFVGHERVAARARALGVREALVAGPSDAEMFERLVAYFSP
jgi:uroporphyrinogen-III synthase